MNLYTYLNIIEFLAVTTSIACVLLAALNKPMNWVFGIASLICYAILFNYKGMYIQYALQYFYLLQSVLGLILWRVEKKEVIKMNAIDLYKIISITIIVSSLAYITNIPYTYKLEILGTVGSVLATFMLMERRSASWILWFITDIIMSLMFYNAGMLFSMSLYIGFTINSVWAFCNWEGVKFNFNRNGKV